MNRHTWTHPVGKHTHYAVRDPTAYKIHVTTKICKKGAHRTENKITILAEFETSARQLPMKCPVTQKYISGPIGMPCLMWMEEQVGALEHVSLQTDTQLTYRDWSLHMINTDNALHLQHVSSTAMCSDTVHSSSDEKETKWNHRAGTKILRCY